MPIILPLSSDILDKKVSVFTCYSGFCLLKAFKTMVAICLQVSYGSGYGGIAIFTTKTVQVV